MSLIALAFAACGAIGLSTQEIEGEWLYSADNLSGDGWHCSIAGVTLILAQDGRNFSGRTRDGEIACARGDSTIFAPIGERPVIQGRISGDSLRFDIGTSDWENRGQRSDRSISGVTRLRSSLLEGVEVTGNFGAARTNSVD